MPYDNWCSITDLMALGSWVNTANFMEMIRKIRPIDYFQQTSRNEAFKLLNDLELINIVSEDKRFPEKGYFVWIEDPELSESLMMLRFTLCYKDSIDSANDGTMKNDETPTDAITPEGKRFLRFNNAHMRFHIALTMLCDAVVTGDGVWDRERFEKIFSLTWMEEEQ